MIRVLLADDNQDMLAYLAALDAIEQATGERDVNAIGYCLGGTLLASTLAYMAEKGDDRIAGLCPPQTAPASGNYDELPSINFVGHGSRLCGHWQISAPELVSG